VSWHELPIYPELRGGGYSKEWTTVFLDDPHYFQKDLKVDSNVLVDDFIGRVENNRPYNKNDPGPNAEVQLAMYKSGFYYNETDAQYVRKGWDKEDYDNTFNKFKSASGHICANAWKWASLVMRDEYLYKPRRVRTFADVDAIRDKSKSPGWPGILSASTVGEWNDLVPERKYNMWAEMATGPVFAPIYAFLKDEPVKVEKLERKDRRLISGWDDAFQCCKLRFQMDDHKFMKSNWIDHESKIGWTPFYGGVHESVAPLNDYEFKVQEDFKRFDGSISADIMHEVYRMDWKYIDWQDKSIANNVRYWNVVHNSISTCQIMPHGEVYRHSHGNKSGSCDTSPMNAKVNTFAKAYECYRALTDLGEDIPPPSVANARKWYKQITYGDDRLSGENYYIDASSKELYNAELGLVLPVDKIVHSNWIDGLQFCGAEIAFDSRQRMYYPIYGKDQKLWDSLLYSDGDLVETLPSYYMLSAKGPSRSKIGKLATDNGVHVFDDEEINFLYFGEGGWRAKNHSEFFIPWLEC